MDRHAARIHRGNRPEARNASVPRPFQSLFQGTPAERARFALFAALLAAVALFGGSSRPDAWQLLILRPTVVLLTTAVLVLPGPVARAPLRAPGLLLAALAVAVAVQLLPLPPGLWTALPGRTPFTEAAAAAGVSQPWRPISLSVALTLNSLVSLAVPAALMLGAAALRPDGRAAAAGLALAAAAGSALLGLLQVALGPPAYLYTPTSYGRPVGLFANVNHQAAVLAAAVPLAAGWWAMGREARGRPGPLRTLLAGSAAALLVAVALVTGSRAGLGLVALAVLGVPLVIGDRLRLPPRARRGALAGAVVLVLLLVAATWAAGRLGGLDRLLGGPVADTRVGYLPIVLDLLGTYFPFGSGFGTFNAVFRHAEPNAILKLTYFNHAHNDLLELGLTGGLPALAVVAAFLLWLVRRGVALWGPERREPWSPLGRAGVVAAVLLLLASLIDYPLRAPLAAVLLALAVLWAADRGGTGGQVPPIARD